MSRPSWPRTPGFVMNPEMINRIRQEQAAYDRDPAGYERRQQEAEERRRMEDEAERREYEEWVEEQARVESGREMLQEMLEESDWDACRSCGERLHVSDMDKPCPNCDGTP